MSPPDVRKGDIAIFTSVLLNIRFRWMRDVAAATTIWTGAIAQTIPILFLTMAIGEARVRIRDTVSLRSAVLGVLFIGALLVAAEVAALRVLKTGHGSHVAKDVMALGLGVGFAWVVRTLAIGVCRDRTEDEDELPTGIAVLVDAAFAMTASVVTIALIL